MTLLSSANILESPPVPKTSSPSCYSCSFLVTSCLPPSAMKFKLSSRKSKRSSIKSKFISQWPIWWRLRRSTTWFSFSDVLAIFSFSRHKLPSSEITAVLFNWIPAVRSKVPFTLYLNIQAVTLRVQAVSRFPLGIKTGLWKAQKAGHTNPSCLLNIRAETSVNTLWRFPEHAQYSICSKLLIQYLRCSLNISANYCKV